MKSPFKFLDSYTKDDRNIFFGRDREIEELYQRVFDSRLLLVYGVSGTGKSSLIHCGLANKFLETDWLPLVIRRGGNIIESMAAAVCSASITRQQNKFDGPGDFKKAVRSLYLDHYKPVFFIFDQFEELFIFGDKEERRSFIHIVKSLTESDLQCRIIFVMREEYMAGITEFEKYIPTIFSNRVRIEKMSHRNALEAIKEPCKVFNISTEEGFAETLLEKLSPGETDVELTYLQVFLDKIFCLATQNLPPFRPVPRSFSEAGGAGGASPLPENQVVSPALTLIFTLSLLEKAGNVSDLLGSFLEEQLKALDEPDTGLAVLKSFVSLKGTKRQLSEDEVDESIKTFGKEILHEKITGLLQKFVTLRILHDKDENDRYELRHDSLASKIFEKITLVEKELIEIKQFLENALSTYKKRKLVLKEDDLKYIAPYEDRLFVNRETTNLIDLSKKEFNKGKKRIKRAAIGGFVAIMIISFAAIMKIYGWPMTNVVRKLGYLFYIIWFLPLFIYYIIKSKENRTINLLFLIFTLFFLGYNYIYRIGVQSSINSMLTGPFNQTAKQINLVTENYSHDIDSIYSLFYNNTPDNTSSSVDYRKTADDLRLRSVELINYIQDLKITLVKYVEGPGTAAIDNNNINFSEIKRPDERNVPSVFLIGADENGEAFNLKILLSEHKKYLALLSDNDPGIIKNMNNLLNLNDNWNQERNKYERWENYNFQTKNLGFTLITLSQFQQDIKYLESEVILYLYNKMVADIKRDSAAKQKTIRK